MINFMRMRYLMAQVPKLLWDVERKTADATRITSSITGMPRGGGVNGQETSYIALSEVIDAYREAEAELNSMREELETQLYRMDDVKGKAYIRLRYLKGYSLDDIAKQEGKDRTTVWRIISNAERFLTRGQNG